MTNAEIKDDMMNTSIKTLRLVLGDQLNCNHSWFRNTNPNITYVLMEVKTETDYALHHIQKVIGFFAAMRSFAEELKTQEHNVIYLKIGDKENLQRIDENCLSLIRKHGFQRFEYLLTDEYRMDQHLKEFVSSISIPHGVFDTEHFFCERGELKDMFANKKSFVMEPFYRKLRKKFNILVDKNSEPLHGKWNFDEANREKLPKNHNVIKPYLYSNSLKHIEKEILAAGVKTIGTVDSSNFIWPINRQQSLELLSFFTDNCLQYFGSFQDAMVKQEWSIYHSRLSFSLNLKMISPKEVIYSAIDFYQQHPELVEYHQLEGFVRQILGWREYMRGIYWATMPGFAQLNYFSHDHHLPEWFWTGNTKMNCLKHAIDQSLEHAYAHHIQRLIVTGNFLLLAGVHPDEVDKWYLGIYIDALEWVEITNTRGMSQFADGGIVGTKPYVSSSAYINKMSNYCSSCHYDHKKKTGESACPFNSLYWHFYDRNEHLLAKNPRIGMAYNTLRKMNPDVKKEMISQAEYYLKNINEL